jgi:hypothetical protein
MSYLRPAELLKPYERMLLGRSCDSAYAEVTTSLCRFYHNVSVTQEVVAPVVADDNHGESATLPKYGSIRESHATL